MEANFKRAEEWTERREEIIRHFSVIRERIQKVKMEQF
jgi:hypothetical protein